MNQHHREIDESELHAYIDGQLPSPRHTAVENAIAADPELGEKIQAYISQNEALQSEFGGIVDEPVPDRLNPRRLARRLERRGSVFRIAASVAWLAIGAAGGWFAQGWFGPDSTYDPTRLVAREAVSAYRVYAVEVLHPVEVFAGQEEHLVKWLSKRLGYSIRMPDLSPLGYALVGGRLLPDARGKPAAQFMFEDSSGRRLTLYISRNDSGETTAFRYREQDGVGAFIWLEDEMGFAISGEMPRESLLKASTLVYEAFEGPA